ncbi:hypothetical protein [Acidovorax sp. Root402]|uniref:DUF7684 family protein n=1 Tax=Acidovorax sp. Root402 TaxID=1736527 RepID=UPI0006FCCA24|nr:hypothetical protein [Acidovorax sp. Root402]KQW24510.1 hypothetical protein ASC83_10035 [Acidovorax sp. Root402]
MGNQVDSTSEVVYLCLNPESELPQLSLGSFRAIVVIESEVSALWQNTVSDWLVRSGCLQMMSWGLGSSSWDDSVDWANISQFDHGDIPDESFVLTSWHEDQSLQEVMHFCKHFADHPFAELRSTLLLHIAHEPREEGICRLYSDA